MEDRNTSWLEKISIAAILIALVAGFYLFYPSPSGSDGSGTANQPHATTNVICAFDESGNIIITTTKKSVTKTECPKYNQDSPNMDAVQATDEALNAANKALNAANAILNAANTVLNDTYGKETQVDLTQLDKAVTAIDGENQTSAKADKIEKAAAEAKNSIESLRDKQVQLQQENKTKLKVDAALLEAAQTAAQSARDAAETAETAETAENSSVKKFSITKKALIQKYRTELGVDYQTWLMLLATIIGILVIWNVVNANTIKKLRKKNFKLQNNLRKAGSKTTSGHSGTASYDDGVQDISPTDKLKNRNSAQDETNEPVAAPYGHGVTSDQTSDYTSYIRTPEDSARNNPPETKPDDLSGDHILVGATQNSDTEGKPANTQPINDTAFVERMVSEYNTLGKGGWNRFREDYGAQTFSNTRNDNSRIYEDDLARFWLIESKTEIGKAYLMPGSDTIKRWHNLRDVKSDHPLYYFFNLAPGEDLALITPTIVRKDGAQGEWLLHEKGEVSGVMARDS